MMDQMKLSVIIPTRNRSESLFLVLESICNQTISPDKFEVIVVDNGSKDDTKEVTLSFANKIRNLRYFYEDKPGLHRGRHRGLRESQADILVYADDDIEGIPTWLEGVEESFEDKSVVLVGGKVLPKFLSEPPRWIKEMWNSFEKNGQVLSYLSILDLGEEVKDINPYYIFGCNFSIRKSVLLEAGGFHPDAMPQEVIRYRGDGESHVSKYILGKKYRAIYNPKASVYHVIPGDRLSVEYFCKRAYNEGISCSFSQIRDGQGLPVFNREKYISTIKNMLRAVRSAIMKFFAKEKKLLDVEIQKRIDDSYSAGMRFHQGEVKKDPELLAHVEKKTYLED